MSRLRESVTNCTESLLGSSGMTMFIERPFRSNGVPIEPFLFFSNASYLILAFIFYFKANYWARDILYFLENLSAVVELLSDFCLGRKLYFYV